MNLKDNVDFIGHFGIKMYKKDGSIEEYEDKNLIMDKARKNMAELVGGYSQGVAINKFVLGTKGHKADDILDYKKVGNDGFTSVRTALFAETTATAGEYYSIAFNPASTSANFNTTAVSGHSSATPTVNETTNTINRTVSDRTVTYTITIKDANGNNKTNGATTVIAYTEAALYAGNDIFSMKTFPARVKEDTVKFEITWSIIF